MTVDKEYIIQWIWKLPIIGQCAYLVTSNRRAFKADSNSYMIFLEDSKDE